MKAFGPIPVIASGTVPLAGKQELVAAAGALRVRQVSIRVVEPGALTDFIATVEGFDGSGWVNILPAHLAPALGIAVDELGIPLTLAEAAAGIVLPFDLMFSKLRVGLAGTGVPTGTAGVINVKGF